MKKYPHNVIRLIKGKKNINQTYWIVAILNKRKTSSLKIVFRIGYVLLGQKGGIFINLKKLAFFINKGFIIKKSVKKLIGQIALK
jgi:hypothetical protein